MEEPTAIEIAQEWVRREEVSFEEAPGACKEIAQSLASMLPQADDWAIVDTVPLDDVADARRYLLLVDGGCLYRAISEVQESGARTITCERIPLDDGVRMHVTDHEIADAGAHLFHRNWTVTLAGDPPVVSFTVDWIREAEDRRPSRAERLGYALAAALGWQLGPIPPDLRA